MNDQSCKKMEKICILNDNQRNHVCRPISVFGPSYTGTSKEYLVDSLLKALAIACCENNQGSIEGIGSEQIANLSDSELLDALPYQFKSNSILLKGLAVWKYN